MSKIRILSDLIDDIDNNHSWRVKELSAIKSNVFSAKNFAKDTAIRSGIVLLYAHWEGFVKSTAESYLQYVSAQKHNYSELTHNFLALSIHNDIEKGMVTTKKSSLHVKTVELIMTKNHETANFAFSNVIKTRSNLNSEVFQEIMATIGLHADQYENYYHLLDTVLLKMRNEIAHGEDLRTISLDENRFNEIYEKVKELIEMFYNQVENAACQKLYLKNP